MNKLKALNLYQKLILLLNFALILVFTMVYGSRANQVGYLYRGEIFVPEESQSSLVYTGELQGIPTSFTLSQDNTLVYQCGDTSYGPYTLQEDETAIPEEMLGERTGWELRQGEDILFRGILFESSPHPVLVHEDGTMLVDVGMSISSSNGTLYDENARVIQESEPSIYTMVDIMTEPALTSKGNWEAWGFAVFVCVMTGITILFADELFRAGLLLKVREVEKVEPSDWEIAGRYLGWTVLSICALVYFILGLS